MMDAKYEQTLYDEKLLNEYMLRPALYDKQSPSFKDRNLKENLWASIATAMSSTAVLCESRIRQIRERYNKEKRDYTKLTASGAGQTAKPEWPLFPFCQFLDSHIKPRKTMGNFGQDQSSCPLEAEEITEDSSTYWVEINNELVQISGSPRESPKQFIPSQGSSFFTPLSVQSTSLSPSPGMSSLSQNTFLRSALSHSLSPAQSHPSTSTSPQSYPSTSTSPQLRPFTSPQSHPSTSTSPQFTQFSTLSPPSQLSSSSQSHIPTSSSKLKAVMQKGSGRRGPSIKSVDDPVAIQMKKLTEVAEKVAGSVQPAPVSGDSAFAKLMQQQMEPLPQDIKDDLQMEIMSLIYQARKRFRQMQDNQH